MPSLLNKKKKRSTTSVLWNQTPTPLGCLGPSFYSKLADGVTVTSVCRLTPTTQPGPACPLHLLIKKKGFLSPPPPKDLLSPLHDRAPTPRSPSPATTFFLECGDWLRVGPTKKQEKICYESSVSAWKKYYVTFCICNLRMHFINYNRFKVF